MAEHLSPLRNRVFRAVEGRATGLLPLLPAELVVTLVVAVGLAITVHLFVGILAGGGLAAGLMAWRRRDRGRADYVQVYLRQRQAPHGTYDARQRDRRAQPFGWE